MSNNSTTKEKKSSYFRSNPVMNRLNKVQAEATDTNCASYGRITAKVAFFLLMTVVGIVAYLLLQNTAFANIEKSISFEYGRFVVATSAIELGVFAVVAILAIVTQLVTAFAQKTIPVVGSLYSILQGYLISYIIFTVIKGYEYLGLLALGITIVVVFCMAMLYATGAVRVNKKFYMVLFTLIAAMVAVSLFIFIGSLIPFTRAFVSQVMGNFGISIALTIISIIIASLFLISDFATIDHIVTNKYPAKYEWAAAFGLAFTILWVYVKILDLLIQIVGNSKN